MGCDIHASLEQRYEHADPKSWGRRARLFIRRDYLLFTLLAGIRRRSDYVGEIFEPKGMPKDATVSVFCDYLLLVTDSTDEERTCSRKQAAEWVSDGRSEEWITDDTGVRYITNPDWHSASWLSTTEVAQVCDRLGAAGGDLDSVGYMKGLLAMMQALETEQRPCRIVFWFDN